MKIRSRYLYYVQEIDAKVVIRIPFPALLRLQYTIALFFKCVTRGLIWRFFSALWADLLTETKAYIR